MKSICKALFIALISAFFLFSCEKESKEGKSLNLSKAYCDDSVSQENVQMCTEFPDTFSRNNRLKAVILKDYRWQTGQTIKIKFLNGDAYFQEKVKKYASVWLHYANLKFEYVDIDDHADVKIAFKWDCDYSTWSRVGIDCHRAKQYEPTVNFGWFDYTTTEKEFRRVILHEFGHVLGLLHEHQHPESDIKWNKSFVYSYYENNGWNKETVDNNIFDKYSTLQTNYSEFDEKSIMLYAIHPDFTLDGYSINWNYDLSDVDIEFISEVYPY